MSVVNVREEMWVNASTFMGCASCSKTHGNDLLISVLLPLERAMGFRLRVQSTLVEKVL